jgi:hypothetical protein
MAFRFTEQHAHSLVAPHLQPGEQLLHRVRGVEKPWWTVLLFRMGGLFWRNFLVVATNQRVIFVRHAGLLGGYGAKNVESIGWHEIDRTHLGWGIFNKKLSVSANSRRFKRTVELGRFWLKGNFDGGKGITATHQQVRMSLPPPSQAYGALPSGYPQPQFQQMQPPQGPYGVS